MLLRIDTEKPDSRRMQMVIDCLKKGGIIIYPTDTVYTLGCDMYHKEAYKKLCKLKDTTPSKANFSIVCSDFSHLSQYAKQLSNAQFRILNKCFPGPYTFILEATKEVSKVFDNNKKTIGYRIPDNQICKSIIELLGNPILSASIKSDDEILEYIADPEEIYDMFSNDIDMMIDGGWGGIEPSTIVDFTDETPELIRQGKGEILF